MAGRSTRTIFEYTGERNEERSEKRLKGNQISKHDMNTEDTIKTFTVQSYRDYDVYSDVENVLNLNPVTYIDHVSFLRNEENKKTSDSNDDRQSLTNTLITNIDNERDRHSSISSFIKTASHIITQATSSKRSAAVRRIPRRDDSEQNYYDDLSLNELTIGLFGGQKTGKSPLVMKYLSIQLFSSHLIRYISNYK